MKKFIMSLLSAIMLLGCSACSSAEQPQKKGLDPNLSALKSGFSCFDELRFFEYSDCYKADVNTDKQYVTEGETSAKFTFKGTPATFSSFKVWSNTNYFGNSDFSRAQAVTVEIFNPSETTRKVWLSFATSRDGLMKNFQIYPETEYELKPGYNLVALVLDRASANFLCDMQHVSYINFRFINDGSEYDLYMDNLRVHYTDDKIEKMEKTYEEDELLFFDDPADLFFVSTPMLFSPTLSICRDPKYIASGSGSLMLTFSEEAISGMEYWTSARISGDPIDRIDFTQYSQIKYTVMSNCGNNIVMRFIDSTGTKVTKIWPWEDFEDGVGYERVVDLSEIAAEGLNLEELESIEFSYGHVQNDGTKAMFIDDITLIK